jgi:hypothetical protein
MWALMTTKVNGSGGRTIPAGSQLTISALNESTEFDTVTHARSPFYGPTRSSVNFFEGFTDECDGR